MPKVKDLGTSAQKWATNSANATGDYETGINNPKRDWAQATAGAQETYKQAVTKAANEGRFARGVTNAGSSKWQQAASQKGARRFGEGVALAQPAYAEGFEPYKRVIEGVTLPPRGPKGDPKNIARVAAIATALNAAKTGRTGGR